MKSLTAKRVERACKSPGRYRDGEVKGLYLQVVNANNRSWLLRYQRDGRERWMGLGPAHTLSLKEARVKARAARGKLLDGIDPLDAKRAERVARKTAAASKLSFKEASQAYFEQHEATWKNRKHRAQFLSTLKTYAYPSIGTSHVREIGTPEVLRVLEQQVPADRG